MERFRGWEFVDFSDVERRRLAGREPATPGRIAQARLAVRPVGRRNLPRDAEGFTGSEAAKFERRATFRQLSMLVLRFTTRPTRTPCIIRQLPCRRWPMPTLPRALICLLLLVAWPLVAAPVAPVRPLSLFDLGAPSFTVFSMRDGLPASIMAQVIVDKEGFVWASAADGLVRYDGSRWRHTGDFAARGQLGTLTRTHDGSLWAAFRDRGIARYDGQRWRFVPHFPGREMRRLVETRDAAGHYTLWALSMQDGLLWLADGRWSPAPGAEQLPRSLLSLAVTHDLFGHARTWVGSGTQGLWYREGDGRWQRFTAPGFDGSQIENLLVARRGGREQLWISTFGAGLWRLDADGLVSWSTQNGKSPTDEFYSLVQSRLPHDDYAVWAASRAGLVRIHDDALRLFDRRNGLPSNVVRDISLWRSPDGAQVLWLATEGGMARALADGVPWRTASLLGADSSGVFAVRAEPDGRGGERLWVGAARDGLALYEAGSWRHFGTADGLPSSSVRLLRRVPDEHGKDTLWLGLSGGALMRVLPGPRFQRVATPWTPDAAEAVLDLLGRHDDGQPEWWAATRTGGLYRRRAGAWTALAPAGAPARWNASGLAAQTDAQGKAWLWVASSLGLLRWDGRRLVVVSDAGTPLAGPLFGVSLWVDAGRPVLWLGSAHGVLRVDVRDPAHPRLLPDALPPPPDSYVYGALRDSRGRIYVCTNNGVQQLLPTARGYRSRVFTRRDGLPHDECNGGGQFIDAHDRYWVGMLGGLGVYDPADDRPDRTPKPLRITGARLDDRPIPAHDIVLRPGWGSLAVHYALLSWRNEDESRFRTRLLGDEAAPSPWTAQTSREFSHLSPGRYTLRIEARDYAGNPSPPVQLAITVLPAWWQTTLARIGYALAIVLVLYLLLQRRVRALQRRQAQLQAQVDARTAELHAANARLTELSYLDALTGLANRRRLLEALDEAVRRADPRPASLVFVDVDHFKDYNDRYGHPAGDEALRAVAAAMRECAPPGALVARYGGEEFACLLPACALPAAREVAECIRGGVQSRLIPVPGSILANRATISAGVATAVIAADADANRLLREADQAMYRAKQAGRNCVRD
jgi:diguanylate cyclase (GGDEF)-like protein